MQDLLDKFNRLSPTAAASLGAVVALLATWIF